MKKLLLLLCVAFAAAPAFATSTLALDSATSKAGSLPPGEADAKARLNMTPRHGEWQDIEVPGTTQTLHSWVVYPQRSDKAPVVIVIHEIYGLTDWIRSVTDQLAADGFIAVAPDLLSGKGPGGGGTESFEDRDAVTGAVRGLDKDEVIRNLNAVRAAAMKLPAAAQKSATVGFCWGGTKSFEYAIAQPELNAAVVYYGTSPEEGFDKINAPVLGMYGAMDNRVNATIPTAETGMKAAGKSYTPRVFEGAGHGFLRQQSEQDGANKKATETGWPQTVEFLQSHMK